MFEFATDPEKTPLWAGDLILREWREGPLEVGSKYKNIRIENGEEATSVYLVSALERNHLFELSKEDSSYTCQYTFVAVDESATELTYSESGDQLDPITAETFERLKLAIEQD